MHICEFGTPRASEILFNQMCVVIVGLCAGIFSA